MWNWTNKKMGWKMDCNIEINDHKKLENKTIKKKEEIAAKKHRNRHNRC